MSLKQMASKAAAFWIGTEHEKKAHCEGYEAGARAFLEYARGKANRTTSAHEPFVKLSDLEDWCKEEGEA